MSAAQVIGFAIVNVMIIKIRNRLGFLKNMITP
jgi:hypothetical protein